MGHAPKSWPNERQNQRKDRPGHTIKRKTKGDPRKEARKQRAYARGGTLRNA